MNAYLDNNATTPIDPEILERLQEVLSIGPLNPGSLHSQGRKAREILESAKRRVLDTLGLDGYQVTFCGSASEALNLALRSHAANNPNPLIGTSSVEHPVTSRTISAIGRSLEAKSSRIGELDLSPFLSEEAKELSLITMMYANNESGAILPIPEVSEIAHERQLPLVVDGCQAPGKARNFFADIAVVRPSALVLSGHKIHAPVGVAALVSAPDFSLTSQITGGSQQGGIRAGTESIALADCFAMALEITKTEDYFDRLEAAKLSIFDAVRSSAPSAEITIQDPVQALSNTLHYRIPGLSAERQIVALDLAGVSVSSSSACESGASEPSKVMLGMNFDEAESLEGVRISLSRLNNEGEIKHACEAFHRVLNRLSA